MGYGARQGVSRGVHDRLHARALYLDPGGSSPTQDALLILSAELCLMSTDLAGEIRQAIGARTGLEAASILVSCTHTHSGPDTGLAAQAAGQALPASAAALRDGLIEAGVRAAAEAQPARLAWTRAEARIGRNRCLSDGPLDPAVQVLRVDGERGPLAVLFSHGCHGTVLGHDNLEISADWSGVACERISRETGAAALFLLGAHADIDPRTRGLMDLAIPGQSVGLGFEAVRILGLEVAEAVLAAIPAAAGELDGDPALGARSALVRLPLHPGDSAEGDARARLEADKRELCAQLGIEPEAFPRLSQLGPFVQARIEGRPLAEARRLLSLARLYLRDKTGPYLVGGKRELDVEVQVLRIGDLALLGVPLEPTTRVGQDWQARVAARLPHASVAGIANGWLRYLPHADDFAHPRAAEHYEVLQSTFVPGACEKLLARGEALLAELT
jgi:hypothetical protein